MMESYFQDSKILIFFKKLSALRLFLVVVAVIIISLTAVINNTQAQEATSSSQNTSTTTTEAPPSPQNAAQTTSFFDCIKNPTACTVSSFVGIFNELARTSINIFQYLLTNFSAQSVTPEAIYIIWKLFNNFVSMFFILLFVIMAYSQIFQVKTFLPQNIIGPLILVAILLNFTYIIPVNVIAVGDQLTSAFVKPIQGSLIGTLSSSVLFAKTIAEGSDALDIITRGFTSIVFAVVIAVIFFILSAAVVVRLIISWVLIISAPFVFFAYIIPAGRSAFDRWSSELTSWAFFPAIYAFCLYFGVTILQQKQNFGTLGGTQFLGLTIADVIFLIFALVILLGSLVFAKTLGGFLGLKTAKSFAAFEGAIGLSDITSAIEKRDIKGLGAGLIKPFQAVGAPIDRFISKTPFAGTVYRGIKQGVSQRASTITETAKRKVSTSTVGRLATGQGKFTQERIAGFIGGKDSGAAKGEERKKLVNEAKQKIQNELQTLDRFKNNPAEQKKELERLAKTGTDYQKQAAELILLERNIAEDDKYRIPLDRFNSIVRTLGGPETALGKEFVSKYKDKIEKIDDDLKTQIAKGENPETKNNFELRKKYATDLAKAGKLQPGEIESLGNELFGGTEKRSFTDNTSIEKIFSNDKGVIDQNKLFEFINKQASGKLEEELQRKAILLAGEKGLFGEGRKEDRFNKFNELLEKLSDIEDKKKFKESVDITKIYKNEAERREALATTDFNKNKELNEKLIKEVKDNGEIKDKATLENVLIRSNGSTSIPTDIRERATAIQEAKSTTTGERLIKSFNFSDAIKDSKALNGFIGDNIEGLEEQFGAVMIEGLEKYIEKNPQLLDAQGYAKLKTEQKEKLRKLVDNINPFIANPSLRTDELTEILQTKDISKFNEEFYKEQSKIIAAIDKIEQDGNLTEQIAKLSSSLKNANLQTYVRASGQITSANASIEAINTELVAIATNIATIESNYRAEINTIIGNKTALMVAEKDNNKKNTLKLEIESLNKNLEESKIKSEVEKRAKDLIERKDNLTQQIKEQNKKIDKAKGNKNRLAGRP